MAFDYAGMASRAADLLERFGTTVTLSRTSGQTFNPVTEAATGGTTTTLTTTGVLIPFKDALIDGTRVQSGDRMLVIDNSVAPAVTDKVLVGSVYWNILDIQTASPAGTALVYFVHVRQ